MRAILALAVIVLLMGLAGWLTFGSSPDKATINIETQEIERDTKHAVEAAEDLIESGARAITDDPEDRGAPPQTDANRPSSDPADSPVTTP